MNPSTLWFALLAAGLLTYIQRLSFIVGWERLAMPPLARRALRFVPIAVLTALIVPDLLLVDARLALSPYNERLLAGVLATVVAWRTRNVLLTIAAGMAALLLLQVLL